MGETGKVTSGWASRRVAVIVAGGVLGGLLLGGFFVKWRESEMRHGAELNLKHWGLRLRYYSSESEGNYWPPNGVGKGFWAPRLEKLVAQYGVRSENLVAPGHPNRRELLAAARSALEVERADYTLAAETMCQSYGYFGYLAKNDAHFETLLRWLEPEEGGRNVSPPIRLVEANPHLICCFGMVHEVDERTTAARAIGAHGEVPVLIETWEWRFCEDKAEFEGANVLYMDGHVAFVPLGTFPVIPEVMDVLCGVKYKDDEA